MELIERYVNEVGRRLPKKQRQEVRRELRSALLDEVEHAGDENEANEPTEARVIEALTRLGPPENVAASYRPGDQYLIGPELYPDFKRVLGMAMSVLLALLVAAFAVGLLSRPPDGGEFGGRLLGYLGGLFDVAWVVFAMVVLVFAVLQRLEVRPEREAPRWDPRRLPAVREADLVGRGEAAFSVVVGGIFLALLWVFKDSIGIAESPGGALLLNDLLRRYLPWLSVALLAGMALYAYLFWRGRWDWPTRIAKVAIDLFGLAVLYRVVAEVVASRAELEAVLPAPVPTVLVQTAWSVFAVVAALVAWDLGKTLVRAARGS